LTLAVADRGAYAMLMLRLSSPVTLCIVVNGAS